MFGLQHHKVLNNIELNIYIFNFVLFVRVPHAINQQLQHAASQAVVVVVVVCHMMAVAHGEVTQDYMVHYQDHQQDHYQNHHQD